MRQSHSPPKLKLQQMSPYGRKVIHQQQNYSDNGDRREPPDDKKMTFGEPEAFTGPSRVLDQIAAFD